MNKASACETGWELSADGRGSSLQVDLRQRSYVFPWSLLLYVEGSDVELRAVFHTHVITVEGAGLSSLLQAFGKQTVERLKEPGRSAKFTDQPGPQIRTVSVAENK